jgi:putative hydrolase of HD superfamily
LCIKQANFLSGIDELKKEVEEEIEDYYELIGIRKIALNKKLAKVVDLSGRLRFQKRWAQTPRIPETSVLGHMLTVAIFGYFYSLDVNACDKRIQNNFFTALFHDLPEALTRDIISPVKYCVDELSDLIAEYEISKMEDDILPNIPETIKDEFSYLLGLYDGKKDEFINKILDNGEVKVIQESLSFYNEDQFNAIDGLALKQCDKLSAFVEASLSIAHGIKSKELVNGKKQILESLHTIDCIDFHKIAMEIDEEFGTTVLTQTRLSFD